MKQKSRDLFAGLPPEVLKKRKKAAEPSFMPPMLATLTKDYFSSKDWIFEHKFDGERCLAFKKKGKVSLMSRNKKEMNDEYPELVEALIAQDADNFVIDGEIVALKKGLSNFELLQSRINLRTYESVKQKEKEIPVEYRIFDLLYVDGYDIRDLPILARKAILEKLINFNTILTYSEHRFTEGLKFFKEACALHWEGLIAKKIDSPYVGIRSPYWLKFKCLMEQELVIGGYTDPQRSRTNFGALLVGYYEKGKLKYAGKVGTGFSQETLAMLGKKLKALETDACPFSDYNETTLRVHWVEPILVGEFQFAEWTKAGHLRVPRYKGLRNDKDAKDVIKEVPKSKP